VTADPAAPGRQADVDQGEGEAGQLSPAVLDSLAGQLDQRAATRRAEAARAAAAGGPCSRCGATLSWKRPGVGGWAGGDHAGAAVGRPRRRPRPAVVGRRLPGGRVPLVA
jgi:hypothetical protein